MPGVGYNDDQHHPARRQLGLVHAVAAMARRRRLWHWRRYADHHSQFPLPGAEARLLRSEPLALGRSQHRDGLYVAGKSALRRDAWALVAAVFGGATLFHQFRDLTSEVDERDPALIEGDVGDGAHEQPSTGCCHSGDGGVEIDDVERQVNEPARRVPPEKAPQG